MASPLSRIGKSLVKYFKPIRIAPVHEEGQSPTPSIQSSTDSASTPKKGFRLLRFKKGEKNQVPENQLEAVQETPLPEVAPSHWLDLVIYLLMACKKASVKMRKAMGVNAYRNAVLNQSKQKIQTVGSIVNATGEMIEVEASVIDTKDDKKDEAA